MFQSIVRTDDSVFERVRDSILNRGDADDDEKPTGPGTPTPG
jgi:hypothetical protein